MHTPLLSYPIVQVVLLGATAAVFLASLLSGIGAISLSLGMRFLSGLAAVAIIGLVFLGMAQIIPDHASGRWTELELLAHAQAHEVHEFDIVDLQNGIAWVADGRFWGVAISGDLDVLRSKLADDGVSVRTAGPDSPAPFPIGIDFAAMGIAMLSLMMLGRPAFELSR
jgi:hypothetical protein